MVNLSSLSRVGQVLLVSTITLFFCGSALAKEKGQAPEPRKYYVTTSSHTGAEALYACDEGFHMASRWEIDDTTNLLYDTSRGDWASSPFAYDATEGQPISGELFVNIIPVYPGGWIRTGSLDDRFYSPGPPTVPGRANCQLYTSDSPDDNGTWATLQNSWNSPERWKFGTEQCSRDIAVWCVETLE